VHSSHELAIRVIVWHLVQQVDGLAVVILGEAPTARDIRLELIDTGGFLSGVLSALPGGLFLAIPLPLVNFQVLPKQLRVGLLRTFIRRVELRQLSIF
jgi:hypothetical protein